MTFARRHHPNPAREQWERTERWVARLGTAVATGEAHVDDHALVVLHHCWSMHDWLIKVLRSPSALPRKENNYTQVEVEALFQSPELQAARRLTNAAKHLDLKDEVRGDLDAVIVREWDYWEGRPKPSPTAIVGKQHDLLELCRGCVAQIRAFVLAHGWRLPVADTAPLSLGG